MKLSNLDGSFFILNIVGYQYPDHKDDYWDSNWLLIEIQAHDADHSWSVIDPCLTTFEVQKLIDWLQLLSTNNTKKTLLGFTESYIQFELITDSCKNRNIRTSLRHDLIEKKPRRVKEFSIDFPFSQIPFTEMILALQRQLAEFPQRVFRDQIWIAISGLIESNREAELAKLKEEFGHRSQIRKFEIKWDPERRLIIARVVHDYTQHIAREIAREKIQDCVMSVFDFSPKVSLTILNEPIK